MQHQALPLSRRFALVCAAAGLTLAIGASFPAHATAASRTSCTVPTRAAKIVSLRLFKSQLAPSRAAFFRGHKRPRARHKFLVGQQRRLDSLKRALARCSGASANTAPEALPDPPTPPCSPSLYSAPYTEMNEGTTNAALPLRPGAQIRAVMLFVDFPNLHASESTTAIYNRLVPRSRAWFSEVSYGRAQLDVVPVNQWFRMPRALGDYGLANGISWNEHHDYMADAIHAADPSFDFSPYDIVYVVAAKGTSVERSPAFQSYPGSGIQADGKELRYGATFFEDTKSDARYAANVLIHETGHVLGLPDLYDVPNPTFWSLFRFSGGWDMMSWNDPGLHFLAWEKWKLGWLEPSQLTCLNEPGEVTTTISPLERANGLKAVVVPTGLSSAFVVEARKRIGQDARLCDEGVLVYSVDASVRSGYGPIRVRAAQRDGHGDLFNRCGPLYNAPFDKASGEVARFTDESAGITVQVLSSGAAGYRVRVSRTTFVPQGQPDGAGQASSGASGELAPPQLPFSAISLPFGLGWDLGPPVAD